MGEVGISNAPNNLRSIAYPVPVPLPVFPASKVDISKQSKSDLGSALAGGDITIADRALKLLGSTLVGQPLADFKEKEHVEIRWKNLGWTNDYAQICEKSECGDRKVVYIDNSTPEHANLFRDANPTFFAVALAHELTHLVDIKNAGEPVKGTAAELYLELNGGANEVYVYHQLAKTKGSLVPAAKDESKALQEVRLKLAIRDYVNGGKQPVLSDFPLLTIVDGMLFIDYIKEVTRVKRIGSMSLAGVVEHRYKFDVALENPVKPYFWDSEYEKYLKLSVSLGLRAADYINWKKVNVDAPPVTPGSDSSDSDDDNSDDGGWHDGPGIGGGNGGGHLPNNPW